MRKQKITNKVRDLIRLLAVLQFHFTFNARVPGGGGGWGRGVDGVEPSNCAAVDPLAEYFNHQPKKI